MAIRGDEEAIFKKKVVVVVVVVVVVAVVGVSILSLPSSSSPSTSLSLFLSWILNVVLVLSRRTVKGFSGTRD